MTRIGGPAIFAVDPWQRGNPGGRHQLLTDEERARLARISSIVRFKKGELIYEESHPADSVFNVISGVVMTFCKMGEEEHINAFLYPGDLFGLSKEGFFSNAARASSPVTAYRIPTAGLRRILESHADLDVSFIVKLCEGLRDAQRHALLLSQRKASHKLAMFLALQEHLQVTRGEINTDIYLPMERSSIAAYLGITPAALSRAFKSLIKEEVIAFRNRQHVKILDRVALDRLVN